MHDRSSDDPSIWEDMREVFGSLVFASLWSLFGFFLAAILSSGRDR